MTGPGDLRDLLGDDVPEEELARLEEVDALMRAVPAPPPRTLQALGAPPVPAVRRRRAPRLAAVAAAAVAIVALAFAAGALLGPDPGFESEAAVTLSPTPAAPSGAAGEVRLAAPDVHGNRALELEVEGLPGSAGGYELGVVPDGGAMVRCGAFVAGPGATRVRMTIPYRVSEDVAWVVTARPASGGGTAPPLLEGREK